MTCERKWQVPTPDNGRRSMKDRLSKSEAVRHREESHANTKISLEMAIKALEEALDWSRSWPNNITNLESDLKSLKNKASILLRHIEPVDTDGHVRVVPAAMKTEDFDTAEQNVIVIGDD